MFSNKQLLQSGTDQAVLIAPRSRQSVSLHIARLAISHCKKEYIMQLLGSEQQTPDTASTADTLNHYSISFAVEVVKF